MTNSEDKCILKQQNNLATTSNPGTSRQKRKLDVSNPSRSQPCKMKRVTYTIRKKAKVMFAADTKKHDGLCPISQLVNDLVWRYVRYPYSIRTPRELLAFMSKRTRLLPAVINRIQDLIIRMSRTRAPRKTPVLAGGGGRQLLLPAAKMGMMMLLLTLCRSTLNVLLQLYKRRQRLAAAKNPVSPDNQYPRGETLTHNPGYSKLSCCRVQESEQHCKGNLILLPKPVVDCK